MTLIQIYFPLLKTDEMQWPADQNPVYILNVQYRSYISLDGQHHSVPLSLRGRSHTYSSVWRSGINCTALVRWLSSHTKTARSKRAGMRSKWAHKAKRHLGFNKISRCCWRELPDPSHREGDASPRKLPGAWQHTVLKLSGKWPDDCIFNDYFLWTFEWGTSPSCAPAWQFVVNVCFVCLVGWVLSGACPGSAVQAVWYTGNTDLYCHSFHHHNSSGDARSSGRRPPFSLSGCLSLWVSGAH